MRAQSRTANANEEEILKGTFGSANGAIVDVRCERFDCGDGFFDFFWNVFDLSFNGIIVGDGSLNWNSFSVGHFFVFNNLSFVWNSFNSFNLIVLNVFFLEWNVFNSAFDWNLFSNDFLGKGVTELRVSCSRHCLVSLVD